jgi:hypothetical protein
MSTSTLSPPIIRITEVQTRVVVAKIDSTDLSELIHRLERIASTSGAAGKVV